MSKYKQLGELPPQPGPAKSVAERATDRAFGQGDTAASMLACLVASAHGVTVQELFHHSRSRAPIAATRQLAMYLMHVALGRSLTEVGSFFGRDRTTVAYACALVEDQRDLSEFDLEVDRLEAQIAASSRIASAEMADLEAHNDR